MTNLQPSDDNMKDRIDNLFSGQELPSHVSLNEAKAMKARISELEAELAQRSAMTSSPLTATTKIDSQPLSRENLSNYGKQSAGESPTTTHTDQQRRTALQTLILLLGSIIISLPIYVYWAVQTGLWQIYALIAVLVMACIFVGIGISRVRRGMLEGAMSLMIAVSYFVIPLFVALISGVGLVLAATHFVIILAIVGQAFSGARAIRYIFAGFAFSLAILVLDYAASWERLSVPAIQSSVPLIATALVVMLGFIVARQFNAYSLRTKLGVTFAVIAVISIAAVGLVTNRIATAQFDATLGNNFNELALRMARETSDSVIRSKIALDGLVLNKFIQDGVEEANLNGTSNLSLLTDLDKKWVAASDNAPLIKQVLDNELAGELRELQDRLPQYAELFVTDKYGAIIASTDRTSDYYQADEEWWQSAWNDNAGGVYISQPTFDESAGVYAIDIAIPIPAHNRSDFVGVLRATVNINEITSVLSANQFGQTGQAILVLPNNQFLSREIGVDLATLRPEDIDRISSLNTLYGQFEYESIQSLVSKAAVTSTSGLDQEAIENLNWIVVVHQDLAEAHEPITATTRGILVTAIGVLIAVGLLSLFVGGQFAKPIENLTTTAAQIAKGNLSARAVETSQDEIGTLAGTFNLMTSQLQDTLIGLEQRVTDRTHDLELASEVGRTVAAKVDNLTDLLNEAVELIRLRFNLYYTQVYIADYSGRTINLRAGTGEVGRQLVQRGHNLAIGLGSLNGRAASEQRAVIVADTLSSESFLPNPLLPNTRSEMAVPLLVGDRVVGVLDMQSEQPNALNEINLPAFEALAGQLAVAVQNASLFEQANQARAEVEQQANRQAYADWSNFLNAVERSEKIGYIFNQNEVLPYVFRKTDAVDPDALYAPVSVAGVEIGKIQIVDNPDRTWTAAEADIIHNTATQLSRHIENLRLLAQSEKYRVEAEQVSKRLTREGWDEYLNTRNAVANGFIYREDKVQPLNENGGENETAVQSYPIQIRDENIGELAIASQNDLDGDATDILSAVAQQLSSHIENLRLLEQAEASRVEVQKSQEQYALAVQGANDGIWDWDIANDHIYYSARWKSMLGFEEHELTRGFVEWEELIHPEDRDRGVKALEDYLEQRAPEYDVELRLRHKDGTWRWIRDRGKALRRTDGTPYRMAGSHSDVTERKRNEEIIAQRANQLETVAALSSTASTVLDPDALLQQVVDLTKTRFGLYHAHVYLLDESWKTLLLAAGAGEVGKQMVTSGHAIQMDAERSLVARAVREKQAVIVNDVRGEADFLPNPLLPETYSEMAVPMIVGDKVLGVLDVQSDEIDHFTQEDISIQTTLAAQVAVALQNARLYVEQAATVTQLRELDRLKSSFLANMSHELRTPLNSILGFADVMLEELDGPLTPNMDNDLKLIQKNGQHLLHLINDVLDMAKIESGKLNLIIEEFNLHEIMEDVISITSSLANEKDLDLIIDDTSDHEVAISADRTRVRQVMINLVNNAIKFTEKGKISIHVTREGNSVLISVKDSGIGVPPSQLEAIFQEFTQVDSSTTRKAGGTGLGLPISRRLIEMHGGRLWAESTGKENEGTTFYVFLPIEAKVAESEPVTKN